MTGFLLDLLLNVGSAVCLVFVALVVGTLMAACVVEAVRTVRELLQLASDLDDLDDVDVWDGEAVLHVVDEKLRFFQRRTLCGLTVAESWSGWSSDHPRACPKCRQAILSGENVTGPSPVSEGTSPDAPNAPGDVAPRSVAPSCLSSER